MERNDAVERVASDIEGAEIAGGTAGGLEESGDELAGRGDVTEVVRGEVLEEDVVAEEIGEGGWRDAAGEIGGGVEVGVGDGEESEGGAVVEI